MAIEFRCSQCNQLLRVPEDSAGKNARCPKCQSLMTVPAASQPGASQPSAPFAGSGSPLSPPPQPGAGPTPPKPADPFSFLNQPGSGAGGAMPPPPPGNPFAGLGAPQPPKPAGNPFGDGVPRPASTNPYAAPAGGYAYQPTSFATPGGPVTPVVVPLDPIMSHAWRVWQANLGLLIGTTLIVMGITYAIAIPLGILQGALERDAPEASIAVAIIGNVVSNLVQIFLGIGQAIISLKVARGMPATVGDLFSGGHRFLPVLGASILAGIALLAGMMLCIVPGILLAIWFWPFYLLIVDEKASAIGSFELASSITTGNRGTTVILWLVSVGIIFVGLLALCIGVIVAAPLVSVLWATAYLMMSGQLPSQPQYVKY